MISKAEIKKIRSLNTKKGRDISNLILIEGIRLISQVLESKYDIVKVWTTEDFVNKNSILMKLLRGTSTNLISSLDLKKITATKNPSGIIGVLRPPIGDFNKVNQKIIILDSISDPGNLGTILRTANWFGVNNIMLSDDCVDPYNSKVVRSAMGAHFNMNIFYGNLCDYIDKLRDKNFEIIAADLNTNESIENLNISSNKWALLFGNEAHGLSKKLSNMAKYKIKIPKIGKIESLNVSVACGIFLYQISNKSKY